MRRQTLGPEPALVVVLVTGLLAAASPAPVGRPPQSQAANPDSWQIPPNGPAESNPIPESDKVLARGEDLFKGNCQRCHGPGGAGDGPDAEPDHMPGDLTDSSRAEKNPDGVLFYKIWNGRRKPKMPAFKTTLSKEEVWTIVHYIKTLRK